MLRSTVSIARATAIRRRVRTRSIAVAGSRRSRFEAVPPTAIDVPRVGIRGVDERGARDLADRVDLGGRRRIAVDVVLGEPGRAQGDADRPDGTAGLGDDELAAAAADVDDERVRPHTAAPGHAEERQHRLLVVVEDVQGDVGARLDLPDERRRVIGAADGLGADDGDLLGPEPVRRGRVARQRVHDVAAGLRADLAVPRDAIAQAEEHRLVEQRLDAMARDRRDQQVDAVGTDVDRGADDGAVGHAPGVDGRLCRCRRFGLGVRR